ncbi:hypothetical protein HC928_01995 [bacterium]|nr:hypothetical protein [bacterium]
MTIITEAHTISFPEETSLGHIIVVPRGDDPVQHALWVPMFAAQGIVTIPAHHRVILVYDGDTLAPLTTIAPAAIDKLRLLRPPTTSTGAEGYRGTLDGAEWEYLAHLSGLRRLTLSRVEIDPLTFAQFQSLTHITDLVLEGGEYDDTLFPVLSAMQHLEVLAVDDTAMTFTNEAVAQLQNLSTLHTLSGFGFTNELVAILARFPALRRLDLSDGGVTNKGLEACRTMPHLEALDLAMSYDIGNKGMRHLQTNTTLRRLDLRDLVRVTNAGLASLQKLPNLQQVWLSGTGVTDRGMAQIRAMPTLEVLELPDTITDEALGVLTALPNLRVLSLRMNTALTRVGLIAVTQCPTLQVLDLSDTTINDEGIAVLTALPQLTVLDLWGTPVSDVALAHLYGHPTLRHLIVTNTQVTERGIAALQEALPQCKITY